MFCSWFLPRSSWRAALAAPVLLMLVSRTCAGAEDAVRPVAIDRPLMAYWGFDEQFGTTCVDASGNSYDAAPERGGVRELQRVQGIFGGALRFSGMHKLCVAGKPDFSGLKELSLCAWTMPAGMDKYTEIFRKEDGSNRVLFSFQLDGTILSLGLNINGYVECDAPIKPEQVMDGAWHHCAATFDGQTMRVYLDGVAIGALARPGAITAGGSAPGCLGSANGGECFQGLMDDLRIYRTALTPEEVQLLHQNGRQALARLSACVPADEPSIAELRPLAHWTFNERGWTKAIHEASGNAALRLEAERILPRTRGVHGAAVELSGTHSLGVKFLPDSSAVDGIALCAWTRPTDLRSYREIFRQECGNRVLFSFQDNGSILSLGLNIGGYIECDARIEPKQVVDGAWHHCAATFDGDVMRVYLDGKEIGSLQRPGRIALSPAVPGYIGSSSGKGEHFQGALDDLRIYAAALSTEQVAQLHRSGLEAIQRVTRELEQRVGRIYEKGPTFAATLAGVSRNLTEKQVGMDRDLANALVAGLMADFPEESTRFAAWTGMGLLDYLVNRDARRAEKLAVHLVGMLFEYEPLTEVQRRQLTAVEREEWRALDQFRDRLERLQALGDEAAGSPDWLQLVLDVGPLIKFRPVVREAVAPYVPPSTPETVTLAAEAAREMLERDWLHQADQNPTPERIRAEIEWTLGLADRIEAASDGTLSCAAERAALAQLEGKTATLSAADRGLYFEVRELKRRIMFRNPVVDFTQVLFVDMPFPQGKEWRHETRHRLGYMAVPGARLLVLDGLSPAGTLQQLMPQAPLHGSFWRPDLAFDATAVLFCFKPHNEKSFHLYEINVDGTGLRQLTTGRFDDMDPIYLPDGEHIIFSTTRGHTYVRCMPPTNAYVLARCDRDGRNIYLVSRNNEPDYLPSVMDDGRVIYTRWEYTDKPLWRAQGLWTMNPDGTQVSTFWGNQSVWPDLLKDVRSIPGSHRVMFTGSAHHNWFAGSVGIIDPLQGTNFPGGLTKVTADTTWPESGNGPVDPVESPNYHRSGAYAAYYSPYPLSERDFLVSASRGGKFVLYLMDVDGNRELVYEGVHNVLHALPVRPRQRPPVIHDRVAWPTREEREDPGTGIIYSGNVYQGAPEVLRDKIRYLRVLTIEHKTYTYWHKRPYLSTGPVTSAVQSEGVKRVIGTVPVESDGSVALQAPVGIPLHFQLLDGGYRALQTMRSFTGVMPGETRGCLGCHELHSRAPLNGLTPVALQGEPREIAPPPWGSDTVSYERYVQPVLDQYCGKCHQGEGKAREKLDLTARPGFLIFNEPYVTLIGRPTWGQPYEAPKDPKPGWGCAGMIMVEAYDKLDPNAYRTPEPMTRLSYRSRLIDIASSGKHHAIKVDDVSLRRLIAWVDTMCPYRGDEEVRQIPDPEFQGVDWLAIRPRIATAPRIIRPGPVD